MKRMLTKALAACVGALVVACGGAAHAQVDRGPPIVFTQKEEGKKQDELKKMPVVVEDPAHAPVVSFDAPAANTNGGGLNVGVGAYFIKPFWESNLAFTRTATAVAGANTVTVSQSSDFRYDYDFAPRIFVGFVGAQGLGVRVSWWQFDQGANTVRGVLPSTPAGAPFVTITTTGGLFSASNTIPAGQSDVFTGNNRVELSVWDADVTQDFIHNDCWMFTTGAGIRYFYLSQTTTATRTRTGLPAGAVNNQAFASRNFFNGAGPDILLEARRAIGTRNLAVYGNARAGALFGTGRFTSVSATVTPPVTTLTASNIDRNNDVLPFLETELGVEWQGCGDRALVPFVRFGVVGQSWWGAGNGNSSGADTNLGFFGANFLAGFTY